MDLITGASGFIGRHLTLRLQQHGRKTRVLVRPGSIHKLDPEIARNSEVFAGDLVDRESIDRATQNCERVFHCAGQVSDWGEDSVFDQVNIEGTRKLLESASAAKAGRFIHLSSIAVFGIPSPPFFDDDSPYGTGQDPYSRTKIASEKLVFEHFRKTRLPITVLRPSVVYGRHSTWVEEPLKMIRQGKMFLIGGGRGTCHPCFIENLLDAIELTAGRTEAIGQAYIVGDDDPISFGEYFNLLSEIAGHGKIKQSIPLPVARTMATAFETAARLSRSATRPLLTHTAIDMVCTPSRMSMRKIRDQLGYRPRVGIRAAMEELRPFYSRLSKAA